MSHGIVNAIIALRVWLLEHGIRLDRGGSILAGQKIPRRTPVRIIVEVEEANDGYAILNYVGRELPPSSYGEAFRLDLGQECEIAGIPFIVRKRPPA